MNDRKYGHRGYMESDRGSSGSGSGTKRPSGPRPDRPEGPRGRGADQNKAFVFACRGCGEKRRDITDLRADSTCAKCGADLHSCVQCSNFDPASRWECALWKEIPARIPAKKLRNECPLFTPARSFDLTGTRATETPDTSRAAFDALFKK
ncbi:MAG TPA: hypothetical protein VN971_06775 [Thermoanaerobaculia bacterium]|nr:hypothetical protein [Thermoanaerobaculia bacterium]